MDGMLIYNGSRPDIVYSNGELYGGLHCGDTFLCYMDHLWVPARLEWEDEWVIWINNCAKQITYGLMVRI